MAKVIGSPFALASVDNRLELLRRFYAFGEQFFVERDRLAVTVEIERDDHRLLRRAEKSHRRRERHAEKHVRCLIFAKSDFVADRGPGCFLGDRRLDAVFFEQSQFVRHHDRRTIGQGNDAKPDAWSSPDRPRHTRRQSSRLAFRPTGYLTRRQTVLENFAESNLGFAFFSLEPRHHPSNENWSPCATSLKTLTFNLGSVEHAPVLRSNLYPCRGHTTSPPSIQPSTKLAALVRTDVLNAVELSVVFEYSHFFTSCAH